MKMMSKLDQIYCTYYLRDAESRLKYCLDIMKGKYGTHNAVREIESMIRSINCLVSKKESDISFWQGFKNPPNTPKSRRLGWHKEGETK